MSACSGTPAPATADAPIADAIADAVADAAIDSPEPLAVASIAPALGSVEGGTPVVIEGSGFQPGATVAIGGFDCTPVSVVLSSLLTCSTGDSHFAEGAKDVVVRNSDGT